MTAFALSVYVYQATGSVSLVSVIAVASFLPTILLSPLGGVLADHIFEPLLAGQGALAGSIGKLIGIGQGRDIGFMLILSGIFMLPAAFAIGRSKNIKKLQEAVSKEENPCT